LITLQTPLKREDLRKLKAGDLVQITGRVFTARDQVYARIVGGVKPPVDMRGGVVFHCGPLVKKKRSRYEIISAGPTTSSRFDPMQLEFVRRTAVRALVGKGGVGSEVERGLRKAGCVYLAFTGGAGVLAALAVERVEGIYWREFGETEALWVLKVRNFGPLVVGVDLHGSTLYKNIHCISSCAESSR